MKSLRVSFHGPLARVAINTAGPVLVLYFLVTASAFAVAGIVWWAAAALPWGRRSSWWRSRSSGSEL